MAKKTKRAKGKRPHVKNVVKEIKKVITATKGKKELASKHKQMKALLKRTMASCDGNGFFLA